MMAKQLSMSRSSVYTVLSALIEKGLVATTHQNEVKQFVTQGYEAVQSYLENRRRGLDAQFAALQGAKESLESARESDRAPQVTFFEGQIGLQRVYMSMLRACPAGEALYLLRSEFVWQPEWSFIFEAEWSERVSRIKQEKKLQTQLLVNASEIEQDAVPLYKDKPNLKYRFLPKEHAVNDFAQYTMGSMTATLSLEEGLLVGVLIDNSNLARNHAQLFRALWDFSAKSLR